MNALQSLLFLIVIFLTSYPLAEIKGQSCNVIKDSVTVGSGAGRFTTYTIDQMGRVAQAYNTESWDTAGPSSAVVVLFDGGSQLPVEYRFINTVGGQTLNRVIRYTRDGNDKVTVVFDSTGQSTTTHSVSYDGNGNISAVTLTNSTGSPDFPASFTNFAWQNGNITSVNLVIGSDTIELSVVTDDKNNVKKKLIPSDGVADIFQTETANNITEVTFDNDEVIGGDSIPAGSYAIRQQYTYNSNNDVDEMTELQSAFENNSRTTKFFYSCPTGIASASAEEVNIYPNPAYDFINIAGKSFHGVIKILDIGGKEVSSMEVNGQVSAINISDLQTGMYFIEIADGEKIYRGKVFKKPAGQ